MFKQKRKPIDATFIDFLMTPTPDVAIRIIRPEYTAFSGMSIQELKTIYWDTLETFVAMKPWDPAHAHFESIYTRIQQFVHYNYLIQNTQYREDNFAIYVPFSVGITNANSPTLNDALAVYGKDTFSYTFAQRALIIIPNPGNNRSTELLEFLETLVQFKLSDGPSCTDASFWKP